MTNHDDNKKKTRQQQQLEDELKTLFYRAESHFQETQAYLEAIYFCLIDLQKYESSPIIKRLHETIQSSFINEKVRMDTSLKNLKTQLRDVLGVEVGVEDYEGESKD